MGSKKQKKIEKCQKKIEKFTKKLQKYRDILTELTTDDTAAATVPMNVTPFFDQIETAGSGRGALPLNDEEKAVKPVRSRAHRAKEPEVLDESGEAPVKFEEASEANEENEKKVRTRTRKPRTAASAGKKKPSYRRKGIPNFILYNCDGEKTPESMFNRNDEKFRDTQRGRRALWAKLKTEILEGRIEVLDNYPLRNIRLEIQSGDPESITEHLRYGLIKKV